MREGRVGKHEEEEGYGAQRHRCGPHREAEDEGKQATAMWRCARVRYRTAVCCVDD